MTSGKSSPDRKGGKKKKDKKKFARHKVRSDSPDKEFYETVGDPAETQVIETLSFCYIETKSGNPKIHNIFVELFLKL